VKPRFARPEILFDVAENQNKKILLRSTLRACLLLAIPFIGASAQQLPVRTYTVADGLAHDEVIQILQDSHGFLWFCTTEGLSRFDGYHFKTYDVRSGLPSARINGILESRRGSIYWIATESGGVSRFDPLARSQSVANQQTSAALPESDANRPLFTNYPVGDEEQTNFVNVVYEDHAGRIWAGTSGGLFRLEVDDPAGSFQRVELGLKARPDRVLEIYSIIEDREGSLWIGTALGLVRRLLDGRTIHYTLQPAQATDTVWALLEDDEGRLWLGHQSGVLLLRPFPAASARVGDQFSWPDEKRKRPAQGSLQHAQAGVLLAPGEARQFTPADGLASDNVRALRRASDGRLWIGTRGGGISVFDGGRFRTYATAQGLTGRINALAADRDGNIWVGTQTSGAIKISRSGLLSYREADGLGNTEIFSIFENKAGELHVISSKWTINRFDGEKFTAIRPNLPQRLIDSSLGRRWAIIQDHLEEWWVATGEGLYRFPGVRRLEDLAHTAPRSVYTTRDGLADNNISRIFEDSHGDIWIASYNPPVMLTRWERSTGAFYRYAEADGLPPANWANIFAEDSAGNLWIGLHNGGVARRRRGRFEIFGANEGIPPGLTFGLYFDRAGRLWIATRGKGTGRIDDPLAEHPRAVPFTSVEELASDNLRCFAEDAWGHIYIGTARGVERLDPQTGRVKHLTTADGLIKNDVMVAFRDHRDALWFGTREGLSRLIPEPDWPQAATPPPVLIGGLRIAGVPYPVSELGATEINSLVLEPGQNQIEIDFFGLSFSAGANLRYQYLLEGVDRQWSALTDQRTINTKLSPGTYRFLVRAVNADGTASPVPASVSFTILRPLWQRWWFLALVVLTLSAIAYSIFRYRFARAIELERVRTRIATDLHDDIGASLTQIAILSEVVNQRISRNGVKGSSVTEQLQMIAGTSRELVDAMSDIVWAINPKKDHLSDLSQRMRRFASDILSARDISFQFRAPGANEKNIRLGTDLRREIYLIFKESVNNLAKHSRCTEADLQFQIDRDWLTIKISDNGRGFDVERVINGEHSGLGGHGLLGLRRRAEALGGTYAVKSVVGAGTIVTLKVPANTRRPSVPLWEKLLPKQVVRRRR
jgi:ligand-binding sensor domain-containing protein/signal transduction histidine kinase